MIENLFMNAVWVLGLVFVVLMIVLIIYATFEVLAERRMGKQIDKAIKEKVKRGEFHVVRPCEPERMEDEENHS